MKKLLLMTKNYTTKDGRKFKRYFTHVNIIVEGEEEKGLQKKSMTIKFSRDVDTKPLKRGILVVADSDISIPYKWKIKESHDENGNLKTEYPVIYIKGYESFEERHPETTAKFDLEDEADEEFEEVL